MLVLVLAWFGLRLVLCWSWSGLGLVLVGPFVGLGLIFVFSGVVVVWPCFWSRFGLVLFSSCTSTAFVGCFVLLNLPPDTRFFAWMQAVVYFNGFLWLLLSPFAGVFALIVLIVLLDSNHLIARFPSFSVSPKVFSSDQVTYYWKSRAVVDGKLSINFPDGGVCGKSMPPCTLDNQFQADRVKKNIIR